MERTRGYFDGNVLAMARHFVANKVRGLKQARGQVLRPAIQELPFWPLKQSRAKRLLHIIESSLFLLSRESKPLSALPKTFTTYSQLLCQLCFVHLILMLKNEVLEVIF